MFRLKYFYFGVSNEDVENSNFINLKMYIYTNYNILLPMEGKKWRSLNKSN